MEVLGQERWRLQLEARSAQVPRIRHEVVDVLERECPGVDLGVAALVVTELASNVVTHAYEEPGRIEVEVMCESQTRLWSHFEIGVAGSRDPRGAAWASGCNSWLH